MTPVVGGQSISTDNTCKATVALREFFDGGALRELTAYKEALAFDIGLLEEGDAQRVAKEERLSQIEVYIKAVSAMRLSYGKAMTSFLGRPSNLYSIQLRPRVQDYLSRVVNPVFNVNRTNNAAGTPLSPLYNAMHSTFPTTVVATTDPRTRLTTAVLSALPSEPSFADIQRVLGEQSLALFGLTINFSQRTDGTSATKEVIDTLMGIEASATVEDYMDALLEACAIDVWETLPTPPFYSISAATHADDKIERLSILTQFFLAHLNVYCKAKGISGGNFGVILDASPELSDDLVSVVASALTFGDDIERAICNFCNVNSDAFGLSRTLHADDLSAIRQTFERNYRTVTATAENPHMDDFMILDKEAIGDSAKFVTHQGSICVNFADIIDPTAAYRKNAYFTQIRTDFAVHLTEIPHRNESVAGDVDMDVETLLARIDVEQFERLPNEAKEACRAHPACFLNYVAKGRQEEAEALMTATPANTQTLLRTSGVFTDYSGRTFNCSAYEYAYWAKDTHMCRMLESHMDEETKALMLTRINVNDAKGLSFSQNGEEQQSAHFDLTALKTALQVYIAGYDAWSYAGNWDAMKAAWMDIGKAQRNVPAHIAQEYCRKDRSFDPTPQFNEVALPRRDLTFYNFNTGAYESWFPLRSSHSGLGFDFSLVRGEGEAENSVFGARKSWVNYLDGVEAGFDFAAITRLDEVRTADLTLSRDHLNPPASAPGMSM